MYLVQVICTTNSLTDAISVEEYNINDVFTTTYIYIFAVGRLFRTHFAKQLQQITANFCRQPVQLKLPTRLLLSNCLGSLA